MSHAIDFPCRVESFAGLSAELLRLGIAVRFKARGNSMRPQVCDGDILLVTPLWSSPLRIGEVVLCSHTTGRVVVHRVVRRQTSVGEESFLVQADRSTSPDGWITAESVHGRVISLERNGKRFDLRKPLPRLVGVLAALRARMHLRYTPLISSTIKVLKRVQIFSIFFS